MKNLPPQETTYLVGYFDKDDFWCVGETQDREQANRVLEKNKQEQPEKVWVIISRYTNYAVCSGQV